MIIDYNNNFNSMEKRVSDSEINAVEKEYKFRFPKDIREHYLSFNGGEPEKYIFVDSEGNENIVTQFIPIKYDEESGRNLEWVLENLRVDNILPAWLIPFADETGGDLFCFSLRESEEGAIYYWRHECVDNPNESYFYLAKSLKDFINNMKEDQ